MSNPINIAIASPLGGVGQTTLTVLAASTLHYHLGYSVAVIDCNYPLYTTAYLRGKETEGQNKQGFSDKCLKNMMRQPLWLQPYPIVCVPIAKAWKETDLFRSAVIDASRRDGGIADSYGCGHLSHYGESDGCRCRPPLH